MKEYLESFDVGLLSEHEIIEYDKLRLKYPRKMSLILLIEQNEIQSYYLAELKRLLNTHDKDIKSHE